MGKQFKEYRLDEIFRWGKYKDTSVEAVILTDPGYIQWCLDNIPEFTLSVNAKHALNERLREDCSVTQILNDGN